MRTWSASHTHVFPGRERDLAIANPESGNV
jgi:hypothetical protein